jgi:hypothetical protein
LDSNHSLSEIGTIWKSLPAGAAASRVSPIKSRNKCLLRAVAQNLP